MTDSILSTNLNALQSVSPGLASELCTVTMDGLQGEIVLTKTAAPSFRLIPVSGGKPELLHSAYDPIREAQRWAESASIQSPINAIVLGIGLGYHLLTLLKQYPTLLRHIVVIESDPRILRLAFATVDLRSLILREGVCFLAGKYPEEIPELLRDIRPDMIIHNCRILPHTPSIRCFPDYYEKVQKILLETITYDEVNMRTNMDNQGRNQFNLFMNLPAILRGYSMRHCRNILRGYPAVVSAAGPSLDNNIHLLHNLNDRAPLFIVDTAQNTFRRHAIPHDFVVTGDPTPLNFSHFEKVDSLGNAFLAFHPEVQRSITQKYIGHPFLLPLFDPNSPLLDFLFDRQDEEGVMERAMNVGHLAVNLALHMGCSPIILAGFDYAFPRRGGTTHASDAAVSRAMQAMEPDGTIAIAGKQGKAIAESGKMTLVPGYYGDEVPTTVPFQLYIRALEKTIAESGVEFIDATEGGAFFEGTQRLSLQKALDIHLKKSGVHSILGKFKNQRPTPPYSHVLEKLAEGRDVLSNSLVQCDDLLSRIRQWQDLIHRRTVDLREAHQHWNDFEQIWIAMCGHPLFDAFLGGSVQRIYFLRQRTARARDNSGNAFLELVGQKYSVLVPELRTIIEKFIQCVDLSIQILNAYRQS